MDSSQKDAPHSVSASPPPDVVDEHVEPALIGADARKQPLERPCHGSGRGGPDHRTPLPTAKLDPRLRPPPAGMGMRFGHELDKDFRYPGDPWAAPRVRMTRACQATGNESLAKGAGPGGKGGQLVDAATFRFSEPVLERARATGRLYGKATDGHGPRCRGQLSAADWRLTRLGPAPAQTARHATFSATNFQYG